VKTRNILLSGDLEAKIADFGLMKSFANEFMSHVTTMPAGTLGYLDPEYYHTSQLSEKSDTALELCYWSLSQANHQQFL
jgi:serine/threonine protein kinase